MTINEDYESLRLFNQLFKKKRGYTFKLPPHSSSVILLFSGGIDSVSLANFLISKYDYTVYPLHFFLNKKNKQQVKAIAFFETYFQKRYPGKFKSVFHRKFSQLFSFKELPFSYQKNIWEDIRFISENISYCPFQNAYRVTYPNAPTRFGHYGFGAYDYYLHLKYSKNINAETAFIAIHKGDRLLRECNVSTLRAINYAICSTTGQFNFQFSAPIEESTTFNYEKIELARMAEKAEIPLQKTWSCIYSSKYHCGACASCIDRKVTFKLLNKPIIESYHDKIQDTFTQKVFRKTQKLFRIVSKKNTTYNRPQDKPDISETYRVNINANHLANHRGIFVYVPESNMYCIFFTDIEKQFYRFMMKKKKKISFVPLTKVDKQKSFIINKELLTILESCYTSGLLIKDK